MENHDLFDFLKRSADEIQAEYERIRKKARHDPANAGDGGERDWKELLGDWLPPNYQIVTRGRLLFRDGSTSPHVDVLVLRPEYPKGLSGKELYLAGGVLAAFECKLTLRRQHLVEAFETSRKIAVGMTHGWGSPYRELHKPMIYGLLAHSHAWKGGKAQPAKNIENFLSTALNGLDHPRGMLDILCVSDLGTWTAQKFLAGARHEIDKSGLVTWKSPIDHAIYAGYLHRQKSSGFPFSNVGAMIIDLWTRLGREQTNLRSIADYFHSIPGLAGCGRGKGGLGQPMIYSAKRSEMN